jgi:GTPase SAR1 family protein
MSSQNQKNDVFTKILLVGDVGVGKSSIFCQYRRVDFTPEHLNTQGFDLGRRNVVLGEKTFGLVLWDASGSEQFRPFVQSELRVLFAFRSPDVV